MHWYSLRKKNFDIIPLKNVESQWQINGQFTEQILESGHEVRTRALHKVIGKSKLLALE